MQHIEVDDTDLVNENKKKLLLKELILKFLIQSCTLDLYFRQYWQDERLNYSRYDEGGDLTGGQQIVLTSEGTIDLFWRPDTFFVNEKQSANFRSRGVRFYCLAKFQTKLPSPDLRGSSGLWEGIG